MIAAVGFGLGARTAFAQTSGSSLYIPLIGITSVPDPLALPKGPGKVTYHYAVKNFLQEIPLRDVHVVDNTCSPVVFVTGDDNADGLLDYNETWRYSCTTKVSTTTDNVATATGVTNNLTATHNAYSAVVVGSKNPPPLVSVINVTKIAYPLSLPAGGGPITFIYKVNNPGVVPLSDVRITDDKCSAMSGRLGDTNGNGLLDINEVWIYSCTTILKQTTRNTVTVTAYANGLRATSDDTITVNVALPSASSSPSFPNTGSNPDPIVTVWIILSGVLAVLAAIYLITRRNLHGTNRSDMP